MQSLDLKRLKRCATYGTCWDLGNSVLYKLCEEHPNHTHLDEILAKIWIIGRSYAASIERRKPDEPLTNRPKSPMGDHFYTKVVGPAILSARIDRWFSCLKAETALTRDNAADILEVHRKLTDLFKQISKQNKRSLASKYLHFHFPHLFYLYDSRAADEIAKLASRSTRLKRSEKYDSVYARHFLRCLEFVDQVSNSCGVYLNPRQLDNYLLNVDCLRTQ